MTEKHNVRSIFTDHNGMTVSASTIDTADGILEGHSYIVSGLNGISPAFVELIFQRGPVATRRCNGLTNEALLAILIDRTKVLDAQVPCVQNRLAIQRMEEALELFMARTNDRLSRNVEGSDKV